MHLVRPAGGGEIDLGLRDGLSNSSHVVLTGTPVTLITLNSKSTMK